MSDKLNTAELFSDDESVMRYALQLARKGIGYVEPNPPVGAVITTADRRLLASGYHSKFGGPHAEIAALNQLSGDPRGQTIYVTLEPCSHHGKTPPCADALIAAGFARVVVGTIDPAPHVSGAGIEKLKAAGISVQVGVREQECQELIAPFTKLLTQGLPFVHAKWAMSLDGKIATRTGESKWITNEVSRRVVHKLRGRMDAIVTGIGTVLKDDPQLTVRPLGIRTPARVVLDSHVRLPLDSQLAMSAGDVPVILFSATDSPEERMRKLSELGVEVVRVRSDESTGKLSLVHVLKELGKRSMTNVLLEAGRDLLGAFLDAQQVDEVHCFIAPKLIGGSTAFTPFGGAGAESMESAIDLEDPKVEILDGDVYLRGRVK